MMRKPILGLLAALILAPVAVWGQGTSYGPGLVGWWRGEGNALDDSGLGNHGTWTGTEAYALAQHGRGMRGDGSSYVTIPQNNNLSGFDDFTLSCWMRSTQAADGTTRYIISAFNTTSDQRSWGISKGGATVTNALLFTASRDGTADLTAALFVPHATAFSGAWNHYVYTRIGDDLRLYLNGVLYDAETFDGTLHTTTAAPMILSREGASNHLIADVDEVMILRRGVTGGEAKALMMTRPELAGGAP